MSKTSLLEAMRTFDLALDKGYDPSVFRLLLKHGADPDLPGRDGRTVREIASRKRDQRYAAALQ